MNVLKRIDKRLINKKKNCVWNVFHQFGVDIGRKGFKDSRTKPLYSRCAWTDEQEYEMKRLFKKRKVKCSSLNKYACIKKGCMAVLDYFPVNKEEKK